MTEKRKTDHIALAAISRPLLNEHLSHFNYEPLFGVHPDLNSTINTKFLNYNLNYPLWISSMTGGALRARNINKNLAKLASKYKIGFALGSCRSLLDSDQHFDDFNMRPILENDIPFFVNLGIAQLEELILNNKTDKILKLIDKLKATGLVIHVNPIQEWLQPEGDRFKVPPVITIEKILKLRDFPVIVKEVGQGMGPKSLAVLVDLKVDAIELAGYGGTNFSMLELSRQDSTILFDSANALSKVGHTPKQMIDELNKISLNKTIPEVIISGGIQNVVEGQYYRNLLKSNSIIGFGMRFLKHAEDYDSLEKFFNAEIQTLNMCANFLENKED